MRLTFYFLLLSAGVFAQKKITTIGLHDAIVHAAVDRAGELYIQTKAGQIQKFDSDGKLLSVYKDAAAPTLFEPRDGSRLFAYFRDEARAAYMNPSFEVTNSFRIDSAFVIEPWLVCSSGDHHIWIIEGADGTLKKLDPRTSSLLVDVKLPATLSADISPIVTIREYQGFLFLLHQEKGIYVFNGMGKLIRTILVPQLTYFNFLGEELYYPRDGKLVFLNLFSTETREISAGAAFKFALLTDERRFIIQETKIDFFEFKP